MPNERNNRDDMRRDNYHGNQRGDNSDNLEMSENDKDRKHMYIKRKVCRFCVDKNLNIDYKQPEVLKRFTTIGGKIIPRRMSGNCSKHQRELSKAIKVARYIALLPFVKQ